jgi:hypothetical protein
MKKYLFFPAFFLIFCFSAFGQKYFKKEESIISSKKWTVVEAKGKNPVFEIGEELAFDIDKKFRIKKNNSDRVTGTWFLDKDYLLLKIEGAGALNRGQRYPQKMKVLKLSKDELKVKFKIEKNQKITFH